LLTLLGDLKSSAPEDVRRAHGGTRVSLPPQLNRLAVLQDQPSRPDDFFRHGGDNSNTQFAILAMWAARGQGLPLDRTLALIDRRFRATQNTDGSWNYQEHTNANAQGNPTMTCAGLLGLAVGHGLAADAKQSGARPAQNLGIHKALQVVAKAIAPANKKVGPAAKKKKPKQPDRPVDMYFLWSVERVAVLYQLKTIGGKQWFHWGMDQIIPRQQNDGGWPAGGGAGATRTINTCFAMLFLKRVNLAKDLTDKISELVATLPPPQPARKQ
jgi:hypothetical protein